MNEEQQNSQFIDLQQLRTWWQVERNAGELTEIRLIDPSGMTYSGYYKNFDNLVRDISAHPECGVYATINRLNDAIYSRQQCERLIKRPKITTSDNDIIGRDMVVIDIDAVRSSGVNSTDEELEHVKQTTNKVYQFLKDNGFSKPIVNLSGNGCHIRLKCAIKADAESTQMIKDFLYVMDSMFSDEHAEIDISVHNLSRILKVCGTPSRKGSNTAERPQRMSKYVLIPDEYEPTPREYFEKIAALKPKAEMPAMENKFRTEGKFNLQEFIAKHNIKVNKVVKTNSGTRYILEQCCFCEQHKAPDAMIFEGNDGTLGYHCFHQSCSTHGWQDVRMLYEPEHYSRKAYEDFRQRRNYYGTWDREPFIPKAENEVDGRIWLKHSDVKYTPPDMNSYIPTGYRKIDKMIFGLLLGDVTILSGKNASGKSIFLDNVILNVISKGYKAAVWSGELQPERFYGWIDLIAAGKNYVVKKNGYDDFYYCPKHISEKIGEWADGRLWLFNNAYKNNFFQIFHDVKQIVEKENVRLVVLDNLAALDLSEINGKDYEKQKHFIAEIKEYAKHKNIHIICVAHPRKTTGVIRRCDVSGTGDLTNLVDNVILVHRTNRDFELGAADYFHREAVAELMQYSTIVEISKNRDKGIEDKTFGLYYEKESKRLKEEIADSILYPWNSPAEQQSIAPPQDSYLDDPFGGGEGEEAPF